MGQQRRLRKLLRQQYHPRRLFESSYAEPHAKFSHIFTAAEALVAHSKRSKGVFIFPGQAMRPLFEAVKAICAIEGIPFQKHFVYSVAPKVTQHREFLETVVLKRMAPKDIVRRSKNPAPDERMFENTFLQKPLIRKTLKSRNPPAYFVVDYKGHGVLFEALKQALASANPNAKVSFINQGMQLHEGRGTVGKGIIASEEVSRPTEKGHFGKLKRNWNNYGAIEYLFFQQQLAEYLHKRGQKNSSAPIKNRSNG